MKELGPGFLERVYKNALLIAMKEKGLRVETEKSFEVIFRNKVIGRYVSGLLIGLLINFRRRKLEYQRLHQSMEIDGEINSAEKSLPF
jgi:hypothetical protein